MNIGYLLQTLDVSSGRIASVTTEELRKHLERSQRAQATRANKHAKLSADAGQMALFGLDPVEVRYEIEASNAVQDSVTAALAAKQALEMGASDPNAIGNSVMDPTTRKALDLAVVMRSTGADMAETEQALRAAYSADRIAVVLQEVRELEQMQSAMSASGIGAPVAPPLKTAIENRQADPYPDHLADIQADADADVDADVGGLADVDHDEEEEGARYESSSSVDAFTALMAQLRSEKYQPMTVEREKELGQRIKAGDLAARQEMVERNMRFLVFFARSYAYTGRSIDFLVSAGALGLITAANRFDPELGRFTTVASHWIRSEIQLACQRDTLVKTPSGAGTRANQARAAAEKAETEEERQEWLARERYARAALANTRGGAVSIHAPVGGRDDEDCTLADLLEAEGPGVEEQMEARQLMRQLVKAADNISNPTHRMVFKLRSGLDESNLGDPLSYAEIGERMGISPQAVHHHYRAGAQDVCGAMVTWAKGPQNLPEGFCNRLMRPGMVH